MKRFILCTFAAVFLLSGVASVASASLLENGDFESYTFSDGTDIGKGEIHGRTWDQLGWDVWETLPGWRTYAGAGIEVQRSGVVTVAQSPDHYIELDSHSRTGEPTNTVMYQDVALTQGTYNLSFWYMARTSAENDNGIFASVTSDTLGIDVFYNSVSKSHVRGTAYSWENINWSFTVDQAATYQLVFGAMGTQNTLGGFIDTISLNPVPEPATMMLFGIGLLGVAGIARKKE